MYSYENLESRLAASGLCKTDLTHVLGISSHTITKIGEKSFRRLLDLFEINVD